MHMRTDLNRFFLAGAMIVVLFPAGQVWAQIVTDDGTPISPETPLLREKLRYRSSENVDDTTWSHEFSYALDPANELRLEVPVRRREVEFTDNKGEEISETLTGFGDVSLQIQHSLHQTDWVMGSNRLAFNLKLAAPTGTDDATEKGVEIPRRLQLGQGDWSSGVGGVYTRVEDRTRYAVEGTFTHHTRHEGIRLGEELDLNLAYWYRLYPAQFEAQQLRNELRGAFEVFSTYQFESERNGSGVGDDGWNVWVSPGLQYYMSPKIQLEAAFQVPVIENTEDVLGDPRFATQLNVRILF